MLFPILATLIAVTIIPATCFDPCNVRVTVTVEPAPTNVVMVLEIGAPDSLYYRRTDKEYNGKSAKRRSFTYEGLPAGTYTILATLYKDNGIAHIAGSDQKRLLVIGETR